MVDPVTVAVIGSALLAGAREMGEALRRSSHSPIIREMLDYSCAIFTAEGEIAAQDENIPALLGSIAIALPVLLKENPEASIQPGDIFIGNDPYRGVSHTPDIHLFAPVFADGRIVAWCGNVAHYNDIGGTNPGTEGFANRSIFEEGFRFPNVKLVESGKVNDALLRCFEIGSRDPRTSLGDIRAQIAAAKLGVRRLQELVAKYGAGVLTDTFAVRLAQGEKRMRASIAECPNGRGTAVGYLDDDGIGTAPVKIAVSVDVKGDEIHVDFTGTDPQMAGGMNSSRAATMAAVLFAVKAAFDPDGETTGGGFRPIRPVLPEGSAVDPQFPAAVSLRHLAEQRIADTLVRALAQLSPHLKTAGSFVGFSSLAAAGRHPRSGLPVVMADDLGGGIGGNRNGDGLDAVDTYLGNVGILPAEICEREYPIRIIETEFVADTGGPGQHRGGLGIRRVYEFLDDCECVFYTEQTKPEFGPWGAEGGVNGRPAKLSLIRRGGSATPVTKMRVNVGKGDRLVTVTGGGGGYGDPRERSRDAVLADLREEKVTPDAATKVYGLTPSQLELPVVQRKLAS